MGRPLKAEQQLRAKLLACGLKWCPKCKLTKDVDEFCRRKRSNDGLETYCKQCHQIYDLDRYRKHRNEHISQQHIYYEEHSDERREYARTYYKKHSIERREYTRKYQQSERGRISDRAAKHRRRMRKLGLRSDLTIEQWKQALKYFNYRCAYCEEQVEWPTRLVQEHFVPVILGGGYAQDNIVPACIRCNSSKQAKSTEDWIQHVNYVLPEALKRIKQYFGSVRREAGGLKHKGISRLIL